ncbi:unnamed protein product [Diabrotica balteata]|uniref:Ribosomal protein L11 methyltransferase n=1 Tax=Diabrotica balteata TaxID=107213 RepID=A0A9N9XAJ1_DIABA|nr:unnamed protein product [Diabrotica balteata]
MFPCLKLKRLEERLQCISEFDKPKILLEQYITPWHLGSHVLYTVQSQYGDIDGKLVADLGSGCGALTIGAAVLNAALVIGFEIDEDAINICQENIEDHELSNIDIVQCDVLKGISSRSFILKQADSLGVKAEVLAELSYDLPSTYKFHKKKSVDIQVDFYRFTI